MAYAHVNAPKREIEKVRELRCIELLKKQIFIFNFY